jgi:hypothetical protein
MSRIVICVLSVAGLLAGCSKQDEQKTASPAISVPANPPLQLTVTNLPAPATISVSKTQRAIEVKDAGILRISFPATWDDKLARVPGHGRLFDSIMLWPRSTNGDFGFELMVDVNNVGESNAARVDIKEALRKAGRVDLTNSVEETLDIREVQGQQTTACYFVVTDRNYNPDHHAKTDYRYLTQGYAKLDGLILSFRLVSNHLPLEQEQMLEMIKTARFEKKP